MEIKSLSEISENLDSKRVPITKSKRISGNIPYYGASGIVDYVNDYLFDEDLLLVSEDGANLVARKYPIAFSISGKTWVNNHAHVLRFQDETTRKYVEYYLNSISLLDFISGMAQPKLNQKKLNSIPIPIPPLQEQKKIVKILDEAFAAIDQAKANLEKNIENAKELFSSKFNDFFENRDDNWGKLTLQELLDDELIISHLDGNHGGDYPRKHEFVSEGVPYISANCLENGEIDFSKAKYLTPERASKLRKGIAKNRDVLFAHNATVGPTALLNTQEEKIILGTSLTYYRCNEDKLSPEYLLLYMRSKEFRNQYESVMRQSTRNQVPITKQRTFYHMIPPLEVQLDVVPRLKILDEKSKENIRLYTSKIELLDELKRSVLEKAFSGELNYQSEVV